MPRLKLFFAPDTCARVPLTALEQIGCDYELEVVALMKGEHRSSDYLRLNPSGKVPTLIIDGEPLTENVAINSWLAEAYPDAGLLPRVEGLARAHQLSDLAYCASGLHPIVTRLRIPQMFCALPEARSDVFAKAETAMHMHFTALDRRLGRSQWWYGADWSIVDAYVNWVWFRVSGTDFDNSPYLSLARHDRDLQARPAVQRMLKRNAEVARSLEERGLAASFKDWRPPTN